MCRRVFLLCVAFSLSFAATAQTVVAKRAIRYADIAPALRAHLKQLGVTEVTFDAYITSLNRRTAERETIGENDHLIYYILQSERFTRQPRIEPALSAAEFVRQLSAKEKSRYLGNTPPFPPVGKLPPAAAQRINDFIKAVKEPAPDERLAYFRRFLEREKPARESLFQYLFAQYVRAMRFLYDKEFVAREISDPQHLSELVAPLYQERGHSTDTQIEANFAVYLALAVIKETPAAAAPRQLNSVLIVGPGLDFSPRTDLMDLFAPQSYQPFAIADALLGLKLSDPARLRIHCVDINDRVVNHLQQVSERQPVRLSILSGVADTDARPLSVEYKNYFQQLGQSIGTQSRLDQLPRRYERHLSTSLLVRPDVAMMVSAEQLNVVTERADASTGYDLVIVTNVFPYFNTTELLLALSNIESITGRGGYLIHNEPRPELFSLAKLQGLPVIQSRTVLIASGRGAPLYDGVWTHRKR
ncbi:MAG: hypothetical protein H0W76_07685 [Pyrinomonadaceae bacterium]|nr:hypothetical protein [Pyrinomonadaceae bacterium]